MKLLKEITEQDIGIKNPEKVNFRQRIAVRAVLFDHQKNVAMLFVSKYRYHKIPGGGVEKNEELHDALAREVQEETGHRCKVIKEIGIIKEQRNTIKEFQISYCWLAEVVGEKGAHAFTEKELHEGFQLEWMPIDEAIETIKAEKPTDYEGKFIVQRDILFLEEAKSIYSKVIGK